MNTPLFQLGDMVRTPMGELQAVIQCDLHGCTVDNGTRGGARYAPEVLKRASQEGRTTYSIVESSTGATLKRVTLDADRAEVIEALSIDTAEGHFNASRLAETEDLGDVVVFALIH